MLQIANNDVTLLAWWLLLPALCCQCQFIMSSFVHKNMKCSHAWYLPMMIMITKLYNTRQRLRTGLTKYLAMILSMKIFQAST